MIAQSQTQCYRRVRHYEQKLFGATADSDPADNDSGRQSLRRTLGWTQRRGVGFAQDLLGEFELAETPENGPL